MSWLANWPRPRRLPWLLLISAFVILADRLTKNWVSAHIRLGGAIPIIPRVLRITHWTNEGAAFSLFADTASPNTVRWVLVAFTLAAALVIFAVLLRLGNRFSLSTVALALILGGAIGNVHDRIAYGSVIDFIEVHIFSYHWPDFNVADSSVVVGACLLFLDSTAPAAKDCALKEPVIRKPRPIPAVIIGRTTEPLYGAARNDFTRSWNRRFFREFSSAWAHVARALVHLRALVLCHGDCLRRPCCDRQSQEHPRKRHPGP